MKMGMRYLSIGFFLVVLGVLPNVTFATGLHSTKSVSLGYRTDSLDWNIDGGSFGPNILSELEWRDLEIFQVKAEVRSFNRSGIAFHGYIDYGWVLDGINRDSDYSGDNRTLEFSRSVNAVDGSRVFDISGGLGRVFFAGENDQWQITPMLGYSYHRQDLRMRSGNQRVADLANLQILVPSATSVPALGPFPGLNSSYQAEWYGTWLGVDVFLDLKDSGSLFARFGSHWVNYLGEANWNLRADFAHPVSFVHEANGQGWVLELGWQEEPSPHYWVWGVNVVVQSWTTDPGVDRTFFSDSTFSEGRLNEVNWASNSINLSLQKAFAN